MTRESIHNLFNRLAAEFSLPNTKILDIFAQALSRKLKTKILYVFDEEAEGGVVFIKSDTWRVINTSKLSWQRITSISSLMHEMLIHESLSMTFENKKQIIERHNNILPAVVHRVQTEKILLFLPSIESYISLPPFHLDSYSNKSVGDRILVYIRSISMRDGRINISANGFHRDIYYSILEPIMGDTHFKITGISHGTVYVRIKKRLDANVVASILKTTKVKFRFIWNPTKTSTSREDYSK